MNIITIGAWLMRYKKKRVGKVFLYIVIALGLLAAILLIGTNYLKKEIVCNKPYILVGTDCCLDQNDNSICDRDELETAEKSIFEADLCLISIGRTKVSENLGLEELGITTRRGAIEVDPGTLETTVQGIYAIGDVNGGLMLAHVASYEGDIAVANVLSSLGKFQVHPKRTKERQAGRLS